MSLSLADLRQAEELGQCSTAHFRKANSNAVPQFWWCDHSMAGGSPVAQYYASSPLEAAVLPSRLGFAVGGAVAPFRRWLTTVMVLGSATSVIGAYTLCDYLLYYPFVDADNLDEQQMTNDVALPRYTDGNGVMVMGVTQAPGAGSGVFVFDYINQAGVAKTSPTQTFNAAVNVNSALVGGQNSAGPWLRLADGDTGVRSITAVRFSVANAGLIALVLVKPLMSCKLLDTLACVEVEYPKDGPPPQIQDGAVLNFIMQPRGAALTAAAFIGYLKTVFTG